MFLGVPRKLQVGPDAFVKFALGGLDAIRWLANGFWVVQLKPKCPSANWCRMCTQPQFVIAVLHLEPNAIAMPLPTSEISGFPIKLIDRRRRKENFEFSAYTSICFLFCDLYH